jgi:hypothetical protein
MSAPEFEVTGRVNSGDPATKVDPGLADARDSASAAPARGPRSGGRAPRLTPGRSRRDHPGEGRGFETAAARPPQPPVSETSGFQTPAPRPPQPPVSETSGFPDARCAASSTTGERDVAVSRRPPQPPVGVVSRRPLRGRLNQPRNASRPGRSRASHVREGGVEPPRPFGHTDLNRARLPIPPLARAAGEGYPRQRSIPKPAHAAAGWA